VNQRHERVELMEKGGPLAGLNFDSRNDMNHARICGANGARVKPAFSQQGQPSNRGSPCSSS